MSHRESKDKNTLGQLITKNTVLYRKQLIEEKLNILKPRSKLLYCDLLGSSAARILAEKSNYTDWRMLQTGYKDANPYQLADYYRQVSLLLSV